MSKQPYTVSRRGTMTAHINGEDFQLRPSFSAACEFEEVAGFGAYKAMSQLQEGNITLHLVAAAIYAGIRGAKPGKEGSCPKLLEVKQRIFDAGLTKCLPIALRFLVLCCAGAEAANEILDQPEKPDADSTEN